MKTVAHIATLQFPVNMGEEYAFEIVFQSYYRALCYYAQDVVGDRAIAEDLVSTLFVKLWDRSQVIGDLVHLRHFLYRATRNGCLDYIKANRREDTRYAQLPSEEAEESHLASMVQAEVWAEVLRAIEALPSQCGKVISMGYLEGKTNQEIADEMGISLQAVKNHKLRGIAKLRQTLSGSSFMLLVSYHWFD